MNESERGVQLGVLFLFIDERIGQLTFIADSPKHIPKIRSQLVMIVRETWSNPPTHGAKIVSAVLNNPELLIEWCVPVFSVLFSNAKISLKYHERERCHQNFFDYWY